MTTPVPAAPINPQILMRNGQGGKVIYLSPDVKLTPGRGPVPYPIWAPTEDNDMWFSPNVFYNGRNALLHRSVLKKTFGGQAGTDGGIKSKTYMYWAHPIEYSEVIIINGSNAVRHMHKFEMNGPKGNGNTIGEGQQPGSTETVGPPILSYDDGEEG